MVVVGIDVAKDKHDCIILGEHKEVLVPAFTVKNDREGFEELHKAILSVATDLSEVKVGLEACGHWIFNIVGWLESIGVKTFVLNPLLTSKFRDLSLRKTKTDKIDAQTIGEIILSGIDLKSYLDVSYHNAELKALVRYRFKTVCRRSELRCSVSRLVTILFPELHKLVADIHADYVYTFLSAYPGASYLAEANLAKLTHLLIKASKGRYSRDKAIELRDAARNSIGSKMMAVSKELQHTITFVNGYDSEVADIDSTLATMLDKKQYPMFSIKGIGSVMGSMIVAEIGDFSRFSSADKLLAYAGMYPSLYQSGQKSATGSMVKRGSRHLRYALFNAATYVCKYDPVFNAYLQKKLAEGKHYYVAISHAAKKLVRVIFALQKSGQSYVPRVV